MSANATAYRLLSAGHRLPADQNCDYQFDARGGAIETEYCSGYHSGQCRCNSHAAYTYRLVSRVYAAQRVAKSHPDDRAWHSHYVDEMLEELNHQ